MKIMVTGAAGFLGYHLANKLAADDQNHVYCVDNGVRAGFDEFYLLLSEKENVTHIDIDLNDYSKYQSLPKDVDVIYHLAALNGTQNFYERPFEVLRCCTLPTINLLSYYENSNELKRFIYAGTSESYASTVTRFEWEVPTDENVPLCIDDVFNNRWSYAMGKMHGEIATIHGCNQANIEFSIIRYHNAYGPRMGDKHVVPDFYSRAKNGVYSLYGYEDTRSFIYVDDAIEATIAVGSSSETAGQVVNIGGEREISMHQLGLLMMQAGELEGDIELNPSPKGSVKRRCPNVSKLKALTGFSEKWNLEEGLKQTAEFYLK